MKNNFLKKIYYSLLRNISWYEINNNKNDIKQQTKIEQKILELLNPRSFRITNTNYLSRNEIPVYSLPNFLIINWPKGIDNSYFKSYQVLEYFKDIGMIRFKLTLSHDVSKEFNLKGFDNWQDILKNCENLITKQFNDENVTSYLSSLNFKVINGKVFDSTLNQLIKPILQNPFIKLTALKINIVAIDYLKEEFTLQINWDLDEKFQLLLHLNSKYIAYINEQTKLLNEFVTKNEIIKNNINNADFTKINDEDYLNDIWKKDLVGFEQYLDLKLNVVNVDYINALVQINFYDKNNQINMQNQFSILSLRKIIEDKKFLTSVIYNIQFLKNLKDAFLNNNLNDKNVNEILNKFAINTEEYELRWNKNINIPVLLIEIAHKTNSNIFVSNKITLSELYHEYSDKYISPSEYNELTYNDLNFFDILLKEYKTLPTNQDIFKYLIFKYKAEWKEIIAENPFYLEFQNDTKENETIHLVLNILSLGSRITKEIYSEQQEEDLLNNYSELIVKNSKITQYLMQLSFDEINDIKPRIKDKINDLLKQNNLYNEKFNNFDINLEYEIPYNFFKFNFYSINEPSIKTTKYLNITIKTYSSLNNLLFNTGFNATLIELLQYLFNKESVINKEELNNLFIEKINGINLTNIDYIKQDIDENNFKLVITFKYLFPNIDFNISRLNKEANINEVVNEFSIYLADTFKYEHDNENKNQVEEFKLNEIVKYINQDKFNILLNYEGTVKVTWFSTNNPIISYEIEIPQENIFISDYTYDLMQLRTSYSSLKENFDTKTKNELIQKIQTLKKANYSDVKELCDQLFINNKFKWFKLNKLSFFVNTEQNIDVFFNKELIGTLN